MTMTTEQLILACLVVINVVTFFTYGIDKWKARHSKWRISEATLLGLAVIGGSITGGPGRYRPAGLTLRTKRR